MRQGAPLEGESRVHRSRVETRELVEQIDRAAAVPLSCRVLTPTAAAWTSVTLCAVTATLEGMCAGGQVRAFFKTLRFPRYAVPLWVWSIIGVGYYVVFGFIVFRLLSTAAPSAFTAPALTLIVIMMVGNALANLVIFRARDLRFSYRIGWIFAALDVVLVAAVIRVDFVAAAPLAPYLLYRVYALWWARAILILNEPEPRPAR
jgi:tryptophan-rich sensory protein